MKNLLLILYILMLLLPATQKTLNLPKENALKGEFIPTKPVILSIRNWFSGRYQQTFISSFDEKVGYKPTLIRLYNQLSFSIFNQEGSSTVIVGKSGYLYQDNYIYAYTGKDKVRVSDLKKKINDVYQVQKYLESRGIHFILVFAPNKARIFPEYIPSRFLSEVKQKTNYDEFLEILKQDYPDLHFLDVNGYFLRLKKTATVPLYSRGGIHWTNYALYKFFMDTLVREMAFLQDKKYPQLVEQNFHWSYKLTQPDDDLRQLMNLFASDHAEKLPYADFFYKPEAGFTRSRLLMISDSYYSMLYASGVFNSLFSKNNFWYYNYWRYPVEDYKGITVPAFLRQDILNHDFVILMATETNISGLFKFPEKAISWLGIKD
jgi:hypothetical protein